MELIMVQKNNYGGTKMANENGSFSSGFFENFGKVIGTAVASLITALAIKFFRKITDNQNNDELYF